MKQKFSGNEPDSSVFQAGSVKKPRFKLRRLSLGSGRLRSRQLEVYSERLRPAESKIGIVPFRARLRIVGVGQNGYADGVQQLLNPKAP
jgi:hypothetical protein